MKERAVVVMKEVRVVHQAQVNQKVTNAQTGLQVVLVVDSVVIMEDQGTQAKVAAILEIVQLEVDKDRTEPDGCWND